ncbi:ProQ/FINO family protein [Rhodoferax sp.]|uniref:ProQ/FINO family protein n=1 Tax=Rhodoferax sp. TaxID=50421 RepID=UPI00271F7A06|nr:ProQ/FINO family protein [Rhodoferax sp.]MDO9144163.1 ProQ/FINO family protein [Rhodoferax sp.]MDP2442405.1 ProQ/FINO family protein [Rhodoferax sp.]MDP3864264.1 ProQ/FINO family protein [Rhodoferax sp.]MDZ4209241.1 ProQ/FINO family protein [Rhodoferax sp.]
MTETLQEQTDLPHQLPEDVPESMASEGISETSPAESPAKPAKAKNRFASVQPVLEKLFELYPQLFGERFLPLKLGIFQELLAAHPEEFKRESLKAALGVHTRSTRYLQSVAAGQKRHDLQGKPVEDVAPEHVFLSIVELFQRRQARSSEDLRPKLRKQLLAAFEKSGLTRQDYLARIGTPAEPIQVLLDEVLTEVEQQRARRAALKKAFEASGQTVEAFADALGMGVGEVQAALK